MKIHGEGDGERKTGREGGGGVKKIGRKLKTSGEKCYQNAKPAITTTCHSPLCL